MSTTIGQNVTVSIKDKKLHVEIDLQAKAVPSASGKSVVVASTRGNAFLADAGVTLGLNVYRRNA